MAPLTSLGNGESQCVCAQKRSVLIGLGGGVAGIRPVPVELVGPAAAALLLLLPPLLVLSLIPGFPLVMTEL